MLDLFVISLTMEQAAVQPLNRHNGQDHGGAKKQRCRSHGKSQQLKTRIRLLRVVTWVGRWSMLDLFVISLTMSLVNRPRAGGCPATQQT
jgi:uncharacterized paraquat-inducible protein A